PISVSGGSERPARRPISLEPRERIRGAGNSSSACAPGSDGTSPPPCFSSDTELLFCFAQLGQPGGRRSRIFFAVALAAEQQQGTAIWVLPCTHVSAVSQSRRYPLQ